MEVLISHFIIILILGIVMRANLRSSTGKINAFIVLSFISLFVIHTFVDPMSVKDLPAYKAAFQECINLPLLKVKDGFWASTMEIGFLWYLKVLSYVSDNFIIVLIVSSLILLYCYYRTILRYSPYTYVSILLLLVTVFDQSIFVLRQHLAMAFLTLSWDSIIKKDYRKFAIFIVIAFLFHRTSLVYVPLIFLYNIDNDRKYVITLLLSCVFLSLFYYGALQFIVSYMGRDYSGYLFNSRYEGANYVNFFLMSGFLISMLIFMKSAVFKKGINRLLFTIIAIATIASFFGVGNSSTGRLFYYYTAIPFILVPNVMKYINNQLIRVAYATCCIGLNVYISYFGSTAVNFEGMSFIFMPR